MQSNSRSQHNRGRRNSPQTNRSQELQGEGQRGNGDENRDSVRRGGHESQSGSGSDLRNRNENQRRYPKVNDTVLYAFPATQSSGGDVNHPQPMIQMTQDHDSNPGRNVQPGLNQPLFLQGNYGPQQFPNQNMNFKIQQPNQILSVLSPNQNWPVQQQQLQLSVGQPNQNYPVGPHSPMIYQGHGNQYMESPVDLQNLNSQFAAQNQNCTFVPQNNNSTFVPQNQNLVFSLQNPDFLVGQQTLSFPVGEQNSNLPVRSQQPNLSFEPENLNFQVHAETRNFQMQAQNQNFQIQAQTGNFEMQAQTQNYEMQAQTQNFQMHSPNQNFQIQPQNPSFPAIHKNWNYPVGLQNPNFRIGPQNEVFLPQPQSPLEPYTANEGEGNGHLKSISVPFESEHEGDEADLEQSPQQSSTTETQVQQLPISEAETPGVASVAPVTGSQPSTANKEVVDVDIQETKLSTGIENEETVQEPRDIIEEPGPSVSSNKAEPNVDIQSSRETLPFSIPWTSGESKTSVWTDGPLKETLCFSTKCFDSVTQDYLISMVESCPNLKTLKLGLDSFHPTKRYNNELLSFTDRKFELPYSKNLIAFEFKSLVPLKPQGRKFHLNVVKEVIKCSRLLKELVIQTHLLDFFLEQMLFCPETKIQLKRLHTFKLNSEKLKNEFEVGLLNIFLKTVASTLEILHICGVTWTDLKSYSEMSKLRVLCIQSNRPYSEMTLSDKLPPKLETLIFRGIEKEEEEFGFEFGWPLNDKQFEFNLLSNCGTSQPMNAVASPPALKVVLYPHCSMMQIGWEHNLRDFLRRLSYSKVSLDTLFLELAAFNRNIHSSSISERNLISEYFKAPYGKLKIF